MLNPFLIHFFLFYVEIKLKTATINYIAIKGLLLIYVYKKKCAKLDRYTSTEQKNINPSSKK